MIFISIITPVYNRAHMIRTCIDSVCAQDYKYWEHIIVDDGSTDSIAEVIDEYKEDERIKYVTKKNSGAADSRNFGAKLAKGEWIIFLDSDDFVETSWLNTLISKTKNDVSIITCSYKRVDERMIFLESKNFENGTAIQKETGIFLAGTYLIKRDLFIQLGGFDRGLKSGHHTELLYRILQERAMRGIKFLNLKNHLVTIVNHSGVKIRSSWYAKFHGSYDILKKHKKFLSDNKFDLLLGYFVIIARAAFALKKNRLAIYFAVKSVKLKPLKIKNWLRLFRYMTTIFIKRF